MSDYKAIVICTFPATEKDPNPKKNLYYAPAWEVFDDDAIVQVETATGTRVAKVEAYSTMDLEGKDFALLKAACGAGELTRVLTKIRIQDIVYKEDEEEPEEEPAEEAGKEEE